MDGVVTPADPGSVEVRQVFTPGQVIVLELPVEPRWAFPDARIDALRGCVAVERGPEVYCLESPDLPAGDATIDTVRVDTSRPPVEAGDGVAVRLVPVAQATYPAVRQHERSEPRRRWLVPYHDWANRGPSTMRIWIPTV